MRILGLLFSMSLMVAFSSTSYAEDAAPPTDGYCTCTIMTAAPPPDPYNPPPPGPTVQVFNHTSSDACNAMTTPATALPGDPGYPENGQIWGCEWAAYLVIPDDAFAPVPPQDATPSLGDAIAPAP